jgi:hypothetical protein
VTVGLNLLMILGAAPPAHPADLLPYQSGGWQFKQVAAGDPIQGVFMAPGFDDSGWNTGQAAFSSGGGCILDPTAHTFWLANTNMLLRRTMIASASDPLIFHIGIDNDVKIWINGVFFFTATHEGCAALDSFNVPVPAGLLVNGVNLIAIQGIDRGGGTYFDLRIEGPLPTPALSSSWARLKAIYR